jgi:hypothetical protein
MVILQYAVCPQMADSRLVHRSITACRRKGAVTGKNRPDLDNRADGVDLARKRHSRLTINQRKSGVSRVIVPSFCIHWHLSDFQIFDQSARLHISENGFKPGLSVKRFLDTDHKESMGAGDVEQTLKRFGTKMPRSESSCREDRPVVICDHIQ